MVYPGEYTLVYIGGVHTHHGTREVYIPTMVPGRCHPTVCTREVSPNSVYQGVYQEGVYQEGGCIPGGVYTREER